MIYRYHHEHCFYARFHNAKSLRLCKVISFKQIFCCGPYWNDPILVVFYFKAFVSATHKAPFDPKLIVMENSKWNPCVLFSNICSWSYNSIIFVKNWLNAIEIIDFIFVHEKLHANKLRLKFIIVFLPLHSYLKDFPPVVDFHVHMDMLNECAFVLIFINWRTYSVINLFTSFSILNPKPVHKFA